MLQAVVFPFRDPSGFINAGATTQVIALGVFTDGTTRDVTVTCTAWRSDDTTVVSVSSGGLARKKPSYAAGLISTV
jgi:hypothetical protein